MTQNVLIQIWTTSPGFLSIDGDCTILKIFVSSIFESLFLTLIRLYPEVPN